MTDAGGSSALTVLYIEDEAGTRQQLSRMITLKGYQLLTAIDGHEGLELYRKHPVDIVLTDIMMPVMDGLDMARQIRSLNPDAQIIILTAFNDTDYLMKAIDIGVSQFVLKPVHTDKLFAALERCGGIVRLLRLLHQQHEHIRMLSNALEQSPSIAMITDTHGKIEYVNRTFCQVTGYSSAEVIGQTPAILASGDTPAQTYQELWTELGAGREWHGTLQNRRKNGELYWEYCSISPFIMPDGTTARYIKTAEDITERRRLEADNLRARHLESLGIMAAGLAHDFNNLLQVILGSISLARMRSEPGSAVQELLEMAERSSEEARALSHRLLVLTRDSQIKPHRVQLAPLVISGIEAGLEKSDITRQLDLAPDLPPVVVDESQVQQVFYHLAVNAREAMPQGGTLRVTAVVSRCRDAGAESGQCIHISVSDTGNGIPADQLEKVFDPYFSTKETGCRRGQGLGLSICHAIVHRHGGHISVTSSPGEGTCFNIRLPLTE